MSATLAGSTFSCSQKEALNVTADVNIVGIFSLTCFKVQGQECCCGSSERQSAAAFLEEQQQDADTVICSTADFALQQRQSMHRQIPTWGTKT
ncbi:MAG: hypothetical protein LBT89_04250 [Planctomycetaceae bacterium]|nr:hypothetical protein [Planctomycetaceae bacterium]